MIGLYKVEVNGKFISIDIHFKISLSATAFNYYRVGSKFKMRVVKDDNPVFYGINFSTGMHFQLNMDEFKILTHNGLDLIRFIIYPGVEPLLNLIGNNMTFATSILNSLYNNGALIFKCYKVGALPSEKKTHGLACGSL